MTLSQNTPFTGIILAGGKSARMGRDKGLLDWRGTPFYLHIHSLISSYCKEVVVSCNAENYFKFDQLKTVVDLPQFGDNGPISGILSCMNQTNGPWLILPCDFPQITSNDIQKLIENRFKEYAAIAYQHPISKVVEPLFCILEDACKTSLNEWFQGGNTSMRLFLESEKTNLIPMSDLQNFTSINTAELYHNIKSNL